MTRTLYAWESDGAFWLSAFRQPRPHDSKRPAVKFADRGTLETEARRRGAELEWDTDGHE